MGSIETKWKNSKGDWQLMRAEDCYGSTLADLFVAWQGAEVISKLESDKGEAILCGTQEWVDYYRAREEKAFTYEQALAQLKKNGDPAWLHEVLIPDAFVQAFEGVDGVEVMRIGWDIDLEP